MRVRRCEPVTRSGDAGTPWGGKRHSHSPVRQAFPDFWMALHEPSRAILEKLPILRMSLRVFKA